MLTAALVAASIAYRPEVPVSVQVVRTEDTQVAFSTRDRGASPLASIEQLPLPSVHEFVLRGRVEPDPKGWDQAMRSLGNDNAAKIGLAHAMNLASGHARDPVRYTVPAIRLRAGAFQDTDYGLRGFDLTVKNGGAPIRVARYWLPESEPLSHGPVMTSGYRLPDGTERTWSYRAGGWQLDTPKGTEQHESTPAAISVGRTGIDLNNVRYRIRNNTDEPVSGLILPGQVLQPYDRMTQRMVTISRERFAVPAGGQIDLDVRAACLDMAAKEPTSATIFRPQVNVDPVLANLANITANSPFLGPWNQAMFWIHTDGASMEQINERLGMGVSPMQYQQAAAEVAMHGGLDPFDPKTERVMRSLANPRSILMGMQSIPGITSLYTPNFGSSTGQQWLRDAVAEVPKLAAAITLNDLQQESVGKTCANLLWSGDTGLTLSGLRLAADLGSRYPGFADRPEVRGGLEYARCSPDSGVRESAWRPLAMPAVGTLTSLTNNIAGAERAVLGAVNSTCPVPGSNPFDQPAGFSIQLGEVPSTFKANETVVLSVQSEAGTPLSVSYGYQRMPLGVSTSIASVTGQSGGSWSPAAGNPEVVRLQAQAVSTNGQVAFSATTVMLNTAASPNRAVADALRHARDATSRANRARGEAERHRKAYERIVNSLHKYWSDLQALQRADRDLLDGLEGQFKKPIDDLLERNKALGGGAPPDPAKVDKAAEDAQKAEDDCKKELDDLKKQKADCDKELGDLGADIDALLGQIDGIYQAAGYTGGSGHHGDGTGWFGYVGWGAGLPPAQDRQVRDAQRSLRDKNKQLKAKAQKCKDLEAKIKAKEKECEDLEKRNKEAQDAKAKSDEIAANAAQVGQAWDDISQKLKDLADVLEGVEGGSGLAGEADALAGAMPTDQAGWDRFWERLRNLINRKKQLEAQLEKKIADARAQAQRERDAQERAEREAADAERAAAEAAAEAGAAQAEADKAPPPNPGGGGGDARGTSANPCVEKFAAWLKKYEDKMDQSQLDKLNDLLRNAYEKAQVPGVAVGEAIAGGAQALAKGASGAAAGLSGLASGFLSLGAGLFYAYAQSEIAAALGPLGAKIRLQRVAALAAIDNKPCGEVGAGGVTGSGSESFFYFKVGDKIIVFRGGEGGVELVGAGPAM